MAQTIVAAARIAAVLATAPTWVSARRKSDGRPFFYVPGSTEGAVYMADSLNCTCPAAQRFDGPCKHSHAVAQYLASKAQPAQQPARRNYADLFEDDDDAPYCTPCHRHHEAGQHYVTVAA